MSRLFRSPLRRLAPVVALVLLTASPLAAQARPIFGEIDVHDFAVDFQDTATVAAAPDGTFAVVWESFAEDGSENGVFLRRFTAEGTPLGPAELVNTETSGNQEDPEIAFAPDGSFVVVWDSDGGQDGDMRGVFGQRYDADGDPVGGEMPINAVTAGDQNDAVVAATASGFLVAWETVVPGSELEDLVVRLFDSAGVPLTGDVPLNQFASDDQEDVDLAAAADGSFVAVWESDLFDGDGESIVGRLVDAGGLPVGDDFLVNQTVTGDQADPSLAVAPDGSFYVTWTDFDQDVWPGIYLRAFTAAAVPACDEHQVDEGTAPALDVRVDVASPTSAVVIWNSLGQDGDGWGVFVRQVDFGGTLLGAEEQVNVVTAGDQEFPHLAVGVYGLGLAVWDGEQTDPGVVVDVVARRVTVATATFADGFESGDLSAWSAAVP